MKQAYKDKIEAKCCRVCRQWPVELHHLIPRSKFSKKNKKLQDSPENCIPLCHTCHQNHHTTGHKRVKRNLLTEEELSFMRGYIHDGWIDKWYPDDEVQ